MKPQVIVAPHFRRMAEIFDEPTLSHLHDIADVVWARDEPMSQMEFEAALQTATAVVFGTWHYGTQAIPQAGANLRFIFEVAGGHAHPGLNYGACFEREISVAGCAPAFGPAVAEMGVALALAAGRLIPFGDAAFRVGREEWLHDGNRGAVTMWNKTIGFVGAGGLSRSLQKLTDSFDPRYLVYDPWQDSSALRERGFVPVDLPVLFAESDFIFILAVPTPNNHHMVSRQLMELLAVHQTLVVISRAHLVDFAALRELLAAGRFRAAVDVFPSEPTPPDDPLRRLPNVVLSAHRAGAIPEALHEIGRMVVNDLKQLIAGGTDLRMQYATPDLISRLHRSPPPG